VIAGEADAPVRRSGQIVTNGWGSGWP